MSRDLKSKGRDLKSKGRAMNMLSIKRWAEVPDSFGEPLSALHNNYRATWLSLLNSGFVDLARRPVTNDLLIVYTMIPGETILYQE